MPDATATKTGVRKFFWVTDDFGDIKYILSGTFRNLRELSWATGLNGIDVLVTESAHIVPETDDGFNWQQVETSDASYEKIVAKIRESLEPHMISPHFSISLTRIGGRKAVIFARHA